MKIGIKLGVLAFLIFVSAPLAVGQTTTRTYDWRYYRPSNTGIQGDTCEALWVTPTGDPWIGGYNASFEEGGISKFLQASNRWVNVSNVDYFEIGHPENTGTSRISDIDVDANGNLWMATGTGGLFFNPAVGPASLRRFGDDNSPIPGGWNRGVEVALDGTVWFSSYSTAWGFGGLARYNPATNQWLVFQNYGGGDLAIQPRPGGGYYVWTMLGPEVARYTSTTGTWTVLPKVNGSPSHLIGNNLTDSEGNTWMHKWTNATLHEYVLDLRRPDGTWANVPRPPFAVQGNDARALRAIAPNQALVADGGGTAYRFNGNSWSSLGMWTNTSHTYDIDMDAAGNVWVCGIGGAAKRNVATGLWQRYRITNTGQFDFFNSDLALDNAGNVYAGANAGPGIGGMTKFDGVRWTGWNPATYGLGYDWPFPNDNCEALTYRASSGRIAVSPMNWLNGIHEWTGTGFTQIPGHNGAEKMVEDSLGRLWALGEYYSLKFHNGTAWVDVGIAGWGSQLVIDPDRPGSVYASTGYVIKRTDGTTTFTRTIDDFPELDPQSDQFFGLAVAENGIVWIGAGTVNLPDNSALIRLDTNTGSYTIMRAGQNWPFPGQYVIPLAATPDGRIWMQYDSDYLVALRGLFSYDGVNVVNFPAPPGGEPQWGGLPHAGIKDMEVKLVPLGYELWMSCASRGIAVLTVETGGGPLEFFPTLIIPQRGIVLSGNLSSLQSSDDNRLVYRPGVVFSTQQSPVSYEIVGTAPQQTTANLQFIVESSGSSPGISQKLELFDYITGNYVTIDTRQMTTIDALIELTAPNPNRFIQAGTRQVKARLEFRLTQPVFAYPWNCSVDLAMWNLTP